MKPPNMAPVYAHIWELATETARECGYCLALHGTMNRDLDLLAVPWTDEALSAEALVEKMAAALAWRFSDTDKKETFHFAGPEAKPHGRRAWTIPYMAHWAIDLSVMPRTTAVQPADSAADATAPQCAGLLKAEGETCAPQERETP